MPLLLLLLLRNHMLWFCIHTRFFIALYWTIYYYRCENFITTAIQWISSVQFKSGENEEREKKKYRTPLMCVVWQASISCVFQSNIISIFHAFFSLSTYLASIHFRCIQCQSSIAAANTTKKKIAKSALNREESETLCFNSMFSLALDLELEMNVHTLLSHFSPRWKSNFQINKSLKRTPSQKTSGIFNGVHVGLGILFAFFSKQQQ